MFSRSINSGAPTPSPGTWIRLRAIQRQKVNFARQAYILIPLPSLFTPGYISIAMIVRPALRAASEVFSSAGRRPAFSAGIAIAGPSTYRSTSTIPNSRRYATKRNNIVTKERYNFNTSLNFTEELDPDVSSMSISQLLVWAQSLYCSMSIIVVSQLRKLLIDANHLRGSKCS